MHDRSSSDAYNFQKVHNYTSGKQLNFMAKEDGTSGEDHLIKIVHKENLAEKQRSVICIFCNKTYKGARNLEVHQRRYHQETEWSNRDYHQTIRDDN